MKAIFKNISIKLFIGLMAIQVINLSIDSVDFDPLESTNNSSFNFNYFNSLVEYVSESVMGYVNAFPEYQNESNQNKSQLNGKHISIKLYQTEVIVYLTQNEIISNNYTTETKDRYQYLFFEEINPPPPQV